MSTQEEGQDLTQLPEGKGVVIKAKKEEKAKRPAHRPSDYTLDLGLEICARLTDGDSLRKICEDDKMPARRTVLYWLSKGDNGDELYAGFLHQYTRAKQEAADSHADRVEDIAEKVLEGRYDAQAARVAIDAYKWSAGKLKPKKYGDRIDIDSNTQVTHKFENMDDEQLEEAIKRAAIDAAVIPNGDIK